MNKFNGLFWLLCLSYLFALSLGDYALQPLHKALPILLLAGLSLMTKGVNTTLLTLAVLFSACGDIFLALSIENSFEFGLLAFACAQLTYTFYFMSRKYWQKWKALPLAGIAALFIGVSFVVLPAAGDLVWLVLFYSGTLMLMTCSSLLASRESKTPFYGALVFVVSDSLIAFNKFVMPVPYESYLIMSTYYIAQFFIVTGSLKMAAKYETA